jgi:hypothetical protein
MFDSSFNVGTVTSQIAVVPSNAFIAYCGVTDPPIETVELEISPLRSAGGDVCSLSNPQVTVHPPIGIVPRFVVAAICWMKGGYALPDESSATTTITAG